MSAIRVIVQTTLGDAGVALDALTASTAAFRDEPGCLHAEDLRGTEFPDHLLHLELWDGASAWDEHWRRHESAAEPAAAHALIRSPNLQAPFHGGTPANPRQSGEGGVEFYKHRYFERRGPVWAAAGDEAAPQTLRWPAVGKVRILINFTSDPQTDPSRQLETSRDTRAEPGCEQFEYFRGVEHPENLVLVETWTDAAIYDRHWMARLRQQARAAASGTAPAPAAPFQRRYGRAGFEWYAQTWFALAGGVWMAEAPEQRAATVIW